MTESAIRMCRLCMTAACLALLTGCGSDRAPDAPPGPDDGEVRANVARETSPDVSPADLAALVRGNTEFALDLYRRVKADEDNLFFSPHSISLAFSMLYAGAAADTAAQMAGALRYHLPGAAHHAAFNSLDLELARRGTAPAPTPMVAAKPEGFHLSIANAMWGQLGFPFEAPFLETLAVNYGVGMRVVDFSTDYEGARQAVNRWVAEQTADRIRDILPPRSLNELTRFVLANAIYFVAAWEQEFNPEVTSPRPFHPLDGSPAPMPMMHGEMTLPYVEGDGYQAVELAYRGGQLSMVVLLPAAREFTAFEDSLSTARLEEIIRGLTPRLVRLSLPRFGVETDLDLIVLLEALGMTDAFSPTRADFSGICRPISLYVSVALHRAFVDVDEAGTEAGAATVIGGGETSLPPDDIYIMTVDRPFIFLMRDRPTGAVLFLGRVTTTATGR